jgi:hypothetical protein
MGNFLGDGEDQFLIENANGAIDIGQVSGSSTTFVKVAALGDGWTFDGSGDYLGLGKDQFLIENTNGAVDIGTVSGSLSGASTSFVQVSALGAEWAFEGSGDFYGDGKDQFMVFNTNGAVDIGEVQANHTTTYTQVSSISPSSWRFEGVGDFLGDGKDQFLLFNTNGAIDVGEVNAAHNGVTYTQVGSISPAQWKFVGAGDYYGTGTFSFLIENTNGALDTGTVVNGKLQYQQVSGLGSEWTFKG